VRQEQLRTATGEWALQREQEAWQLQKQSAQATAQLTQQFLNQWGVGMQNLTDLYDRVLSGEGASGQLGDLSSRIMDELNEFQETYAPMEREFFEQARDDLRARSEMTGQLRDLTRADYEGVAGRARADVAGQSEMARQSAAREAMSMGLDPTSGKFGALTKKSYLDEARNTAIAMNIARRGEKERVAGLTGQAIELIDPRIAAEIGQGLQESRTGMIGNITDIARAQADIESSRANILNSYAQNVVSPYGQVGFSLLGNQIGQGMYAGGGYAVPMPTSTGGGTTDTGSSVRTAVPITGGSSLQGTMTPAETAYWNSAAGKYAAARQKSYLYR
jgi:hypothetical protein